MLKVRAIAIVAMLSLPIATFAQDPKSNSRTDLKPATKQISGTVKCASIGETLIGAVVYSLPGGKNAAVTDVYGRYTITLPLTIEQIVFSTIGYANDTVNVAGNESRTVNVELKEKVLTADEVIVTANSGVHRVAQAAIGVEKISTQEIDKIPVLFGEKDILKTMQLLPGIKSSGEASSGFSVRGGSLGQNLILLDDAPVYSASHMLGFFSTFNAEATKDVAVYKGNFPAQYGGRVASVVDVTMKDGNTKNYGGNVGIGLISSNASFEGPIQKNKSSFLVTARRTYADVFANLSEEFKGNKLYFYDLNAKANVEINPNNKIFFSGYLGRDVTAIKDMIGMDWGNKTATLRWNSKVSDRLFSNTMLIYSDYNYGIDAIMKDFNATIKSRIEDVTLKQNFNLSVGSSGNFVKFGLQSTYHGITPTRIENGMFTNPGDRTTRNSWENAVYGSFVGQLTNFLNIEAGLRVSSYTIVGAGTYNTYDEGKLVNTTVLKRGQFGKTYVNFEPRVSASFLVNRYNSFKIAYGRSSQYLHMLSNSSISTPTDQWHGTSYTIKPTIVDQVSAGYFKNFNKIGLDVSLEGYYKWSQNEIDFKAGSNMYSAPDIESELRTGIGRAYGVELLVRKNIGWFTGWVGYTWSSSERKIYGVNNDKWFPTKQDITHEVSVVAMFNLGKGWELSATWCYKTGIPYTIPTGKYLIDNKIFYQFSGRNEYRMPAYHRLDIGATYNAPRKKGLQGSWNISLYNAYGRQNPYMIRFNESEGGKTVVEQTSLFRWVPSVSYNLKFTIKSKQK